MSGFLYLTLGDGRTGMSRQDSNLSVTSVRTVLKQGGFRVIICLLLIGILLFNSDHLFAAYRYIILYPRKKGGDLLKKNATSLSPESELSQAWLTSTDDLRYICGYILGNFICPSSRCPLFLLSVTKASQNFSSSKTALWCRDNENTNIHTGV